MWHSKQHKQRLKGPLNSTSSYRNIWHSRRIASWNQWNRMEHSSSSIAPTEDKNNLIDIDPRSHLEVADFKHRWAIPFVLSFFITVLICSVWYRKFDFFTRPSSIKNWKRNWIFRHILWVIFSAALYSRSISVFLLIFLLNGIFGMQWYGCKNSFHR